MTTDEEIDRNASPCRIHGKECIEYRLKVMKLAREDERQKPHSHDLCCNIERIKKQAKTIDEQENEIQKLKEDVDYFAFWADENMKTLESEFNQNKKFRDVLIPLTEEYYPKTMWPDLTKAELDKIDSYCRRNLGFSRDRFGAFVARTVLLSFKEKAKKALEGNSGP